MVAKMRFTAAVIVTLTLLHYSAANVDPSCLVDVVFCVDNSGSIGNGTNWRNVVEYTQSLAKQLNVGPDTTHAALVDFGWKGYLVFDLNKYRQEADVVAAIGRLDYRGESTNTYAGLKASHTILTNALYGPRQGVNKLIILITDGDPNTDVDKLQPEVDSIKGEQIRIVTVAIGSQIQEIQMRAIASSPRDYVHAADFNSMQVIKDSTINEETCNKPPPTTPAPTTTQAPTTTTPPPTTRAPGITGTPGATYIRWGSTDCPAAAKLVYRGSLSGSHYAQVGSGHEYLCLPESPEWGKTVPGDQGWTGYLYGAEYELTAEYNKDKTPFSFDNYAGSSLLNNDIPCAVCVNPNAYATLMIPAAKNCIKEDWNLEYTGYLASSDKTLRGREYICMDGTPDVLVRGTDNLDGARLYPVQARCGALPCPKYVESWELTCSVCSK